MDRQAVDCTPALSRQELMEIKAFEQRVENRTHLIKTKTEYIRKPLLLMKHMKMEDYQALLQRKFGYTDSDAENDREEISDLMTEYFAFRNKYSEEDITIAEQYYQNEDKENKILLEKKQKDEKEKEAKMRAIVAETERKYTPSLQTSTLLPAFSMCSKMTTKRPDTETAGPSCKKVCLEYDLTTTTKENVQNLEEYDNEKHKIEMKLLSYISSIWAITPVWRLYTFRFPRYVVPVSHPKLATTFERDGSCKYMDAVPVGDTTKLEARIWTRRVKAFGITPGWKTCLNDRAQCAVNQIRAGDGMEKFLESTSRRQGDPWTPQYQSLTIMVENVGNKDIPEQYPYVIYCLIGRANIGRDIDSKSYLLVRPRYFDQNVLITNERYNEDTLHEWLRKMAKEENGRIYCGSTDFRITTCVKQIQETLEQKTV